MSTRTRYNLLINLQILCEDTEVSVYMGEDGINWNPLEIYGSRQDRSCNLDHALGLGSTRLGCMYKMLEVLISNLGWHFFPLKYV